MLTSRVMTSPPDPTVAAGAQAGGLASTQYWMAPELHSRQQLANALLLVSVLFEGMQDAVLQSPQASFNFFLGKRLSLVLLPCTLVTLGSPVPMTCQHLKGCCSSPRPAA